MLTWICVSGTPPYRVDLPQWKTLWLHANPLYTPASSSKLVDYHLPQEAAKIHAIQISELQQEDNLSLTFDGNTTRLPQSVYTIHVITPKRREYLFEGNEASDTSHTADHLWGVVKGVRILLNHEFDDLTSYQVMVSIGPQHFNSVCSDNTGNTRKSRSNGQDEFRWLLNMPDPCHRGSNLIRDIMKLPHFKPVRSLCKDERK